MQEIWKDITGFESLYQVSSFGRIKFLSRVFPCRFGTRTIKEHFVNLSNNEYGYYRVCLSFNGELKRFFVHRLVAMAFLPNPDNLPQVNHKDGDKRNNHVENLEWCTSQQNIIHSLETGLKKINSVYQFSVDGKLIKKWSTITQASKELGIKRRRIEACLFGGSLTSFGYIFSYYDNADDIVKMIKSSKRRVKKILKYDKGYNLIKIYPSISEAESFEHIKDKTFKKYCNSGKIYKNHYWEFGGD